MVSCLDVFQPIRTQEVSFDRTCEGSPFELRKCAKVFPDHGCFLGLEFGLGSFPFREKPAGLKVRVGRKTCPLLPHFAAMSHPEFGSTH